MISLARRSRVIMYCYRFLCFLLLSTSLLCDAQQRQSSQRQEQRSSPADTPYIRRRPPPPPLPPARAVDYYAPAIQPQQLLQQTGGFRGLAGSYCSTLPAAEYCCEHSPIPIRSDDRCAVPVAGTFCYCDQFCDRYGPHPASADDPSGRSYFDYGDCCSDYWSYCSARSGRSAAAALVEDFRAPQTTRNDYYNPRQSQPPSPRRRQQRPLPPPRDEVADYDEQFTEERLEDYDSDILQHVARTRGETRHQNWPRVVGKALDTADNEVCTVRTRDGLQHVRVGETARLNCNDCTCVSSSSGDGGGRGGPTGPTQLVCTERLCLIEPLFIDQINADYATYGWQAGNYTPYWGRTLRWGIKHRLGTHKPKKQPETGSSTYFKNLTFEKVPESFDARDRWPRLVGAVVDQGACAASWAYGTVQTAQDRYNIRASQQDQHGSSSRRRTDAATEHLSVEQLVACDMKRNQLGCRGGNVDKAWAYLARQGVVDESCYPTEIDWLTTMTGTSGQSNKTWSPVCKIGKRQQTGMLEFECPNDMGGRQTHQAHRYVASQVEYLFLPAELEIQSLLMRYGPLQAVIRVRPDFFMYSDGVYSFTDQLEQHLLSTKFKHVADEVAKKHHKHHHNMLEGHHAVRIVGWGLDYSSGKPIKYWECANSWGTWWGREGYFRIRRGGGESDIETFIVNAHVERSPAHTSSASYDDGKPSSLATYDEGERDYQNDVSVDYSATFSSDDSIGRYRRNHSEVKFEVVPHYLHMKQHQENLANVLRPRREMCLFLGIFILSRLWLFVFKV